MKKLLILLIISSMVLALFSCATATVEIQEDEEINELDDENEAKMDTDEAKELENDTKTVAEETAEPENTAEEDLPDLSFLPKEFLFSSGAGAWGTVLTLDPNGRFSGEYHDSDMGDMGESYPNGTVYICNFSGKFDIKQINSYSYSLTLSEYKADQTDGAEWIEDGVRYVGSDAYGISGCTQFILYTKDAPESEFTEDFRSWSPGRYDNSATVSSYAIYNTVDGYGFFEYDY